jgi:leucyl aminopeptidase
MKKLTFSAGLIISCIAIISLSAAAKNKIYNSNLVKQEKSLSTEITQTNKPVWLSIGTDAWTKIEKITPKGLSPSLAPQALLPTQNSEAKIISLPESQISSLSEYMHDEFNRCGGFVFHESMEDAVAYTQRSQLMNLSFSQQAITPLLINYTIDNPAAVSTLLNTISPTNFDVTVSTLASYNNRYYTQQTGVDSANWIKNNWQNIGQSRSDISVELFNHSWAQPSVIATIAGALLPDEIVIIGGHLDSINSSNPSNGRAPGADDNASGIAVVTEALRAIVASGFKPARTIKFMGYAAEEVGLRGSKAIAAQFSNNSQNVVGVVQFDMTGNQGTAGKDIVFMTDYTSSVQNNFMMQLIDTYLSDIVYDTSTCGYACSDHASWHNQGYPASIPFESRMSDANSAIHSSNDDTIDSSHAFNFARLAVTFLAELAKSDDWVIPPDNSQLINGETVINLSASTNSYLNYTFDVPTDASNIQFVMSGGTGDADLYVKFGSPPTDTSYDCRPYKNGNIESCTGANTGGTYYVRIKAYSSFFGLNLTASFEKDDGQDPTPIDQTISNISLAQGEWYYYDIDLSAGYSNLSVTMSGGSGDADLYLSQGAQPTTSNYSCRPYKSGNNESCTQTAPAPDSWYIGIRGYSASAGVNLSITAIP